MPRSRFRLAILQLNPTVGDLASNADRILEQLRTAENLGAQLAVTPELSLTGYPPEDLLLRPAFIRSSEAQLRRLAREVRSTTLICGHPAPAPSVFGVRSFNSAAVIRQRRVIAEYHKMALPNYGVFDEQRYFIPGARPLVLDLHNAGGTRVRAAVSICEDLWPEGGGVYFGALSAYRPDILINLSASPYARGKLTERLAAMRAAARRTGAHIVYANPVGGQDELIFDGRSFVMDPNGKLLGRAAAFKEDVLCLDLPVPSAVRRTRTPASVHLQALATTDPPSEGAATTAEPVPWPKPDSEEEVLAGIEVSLRDYVEKNGFSAVGVAMSGGIDSALVAALAVRALGPQKVVGVTLPSRITSRATRSDAEAQARSMGIRFFTIPIHDILRSFVKSLRPSADRNGTEGPVEENLQARIRGTLMMALSNRMGFLLLATGNKSELATGYCTLYGDMAGGFAPIKDLTKTWVYRLARCVNRLEGRAVIPMSVIRRAPTAELRPGQKDQDTLPPYPVLDALLEQFVERDVAAQALSRKGRRAHATDTARRVLLNEYKRRQAPVGPKITPKAFGRDRRMPITQRAGESY